MTVQKHYRVCNLCEAMCGLEIEHDGKKVLNVKGDKNDPFSKGSICPKGALIHKLHEDPDRLKQPMKKNSHGEWAPISWQDALDHSAEQIIKIQNKYGRDAIALYLGNPTVHNFGMMMFVGELKRMLGTKNQFSPTSMDQLPHHFIGYYMFGHALNLPIPDINRTKMLIMIGANPMASNGSMMSGCGPLEKIKSIQKKGGKIILIDPRKNETARHVDTHHYIRPGTDIYLLLAMLHLIIKNEWINLGHLKEHVKGLDKIINIASTCTPEMASVLTGIKNKDIVTMTKEFSHEKKAVLYGRMGMSTQEHGGLCHWLITVLNILTGHLDTEGGAMFTKPAVSIKRQKGFKKSHDRWKSRVRGLSEFGGELPVSVLSEEITTPGEGQIKGLITYAGNPVLSSPNGKRLDQSLPRLEFMLCIDIFLNATTRHADIILPTPSHLEIDHYDLVFNQLSVSNNAKFSEALFPPDDQRLYDWQVIKELVKRLEKNSNKKRSFLHKHLTPRQLLNLGLINGPYGKLSHPKQLVSGLSLKKLIKSKHGISLGPLTRMIPEVLNTYDKKIDLSNEVFIYGINQLSLKPDLDLDDNEFFYIGRRHLRNNNSWMNNVKKLSGGKPRCTVMMNVSDADKLGINSGDNLVVESNTGRINLPVELTENIMPGVVSIPHGYGHNKPGVKLQTAASEPLAGVSINDITDHNRLDAVTGNAAFSGTRVRIIKVQKTDS